MNEFAKLAIAAHMSSGELRCTAHPLLREIAKNKGINFDVVGDLIILPLSLL
jgi:hypothetical protein